MKKKKGKEVMPLFLLRNRNNPTNLTEEMKEVNKVYKKIDIVSIDNNSRRCEILY